MSSSLEQTPQKGWWGRNWIWVVPVGCLTPVLLCGGGILSIFVFVFSTLKTTDVYKEAMSRATANAEVKKQLGEPITASFWVVGNIQLTGAGGNADLVIPISGPKGAAVIQVAATKTNDKWDYSKLEVTVGGTKAPIDLLSKADSSAIKNRPKESPPKASP
jgi:hypothetical protein